VHGESIGAKHDDVLGEASRQVAEWALKVILSA